MTGTIITSGIHVGLFTELGKPGIGNTIPVHIQLPLIVIDDIVLVFFTIEIVVKMGASGSTIRYFTDSWNKFDFLVVFMFYVFKIPALVKEESLISILRLLR